MTDITYDEYQLLYSLYKAFTRLIQMGTPEAAMAEDLQTRGYVSMMPTQMGTTDFWQAHLTGEGQGAMTRFMFDKENIATYFSKSSDAIPSSPAVHFLQEKAKTEKGIQSKSIETQLMGLSALAREVLMGMYEDRIGNGPDYWDNSAYPEQLRELQNAGFVFVATSTDPTTSMMEDQWRLTPSGHDAAYQLVVIRESAKGVKSTKQQGDKSAKTILTKKLQEKASKDYNGWANYVTWAAALHITNNQWSDDERYRILGSTYGQPISSTVSQIQSLFNRLYSSDPYLQADMEGQDQNQIDWYEIANNWMADYTRDLPYSGKQMGKGEGVKTEEKAEKYTIDELSPREIQILDHIHDTPIWISDTGSTLDNYVQRDNGEMQHLASLGLISITGAVKQDNWGSFYQYVITAAGVAVLNGRNERA